MVPRGGSPGLAWPGAPGAGPLGHPGCRAERGHCGSRTGGRGQSLATPAQATVFWSSSRREMKRVLRFSA